jgi:quercetin dioxygenase-like cupin family protein
MKQIFDSKLLVFAICLFLLACNSQEKKTESDNTKTDSTKTTMTDNTSNNQALDAVKVAPTLYKVEKDTLGIRVLDIDYKPGDSSGMHWHPDAAFYAIEGGKSEFTAKDGAKQAMEIKNGMVVITPSTTHSVKNVGTTSFKAILVEVNRPNTKAAQDESMDPVKVSPSLYKVLRDTMNIRVLETVYKPGQSSVMHAHPDYAIYFNEGGKAEFTSKDGKKQVLPIEKGKVLILPGDVHSVKNIGNTTIKGVLIEVNRPRK